MFLWELFYLCIVVSKQCIQTHLVHMHFAEWSLGLNKQKETQGRRKIWFLSRAELSILCHRLQKPNWNLRFALAAASSGVCVVSRLQCCNIALRLENLTAAEWKGQKACDENEIKISVLHPVVNLIAIDALMLIFLFCFSKLPNRCQGLNSDLPHHNFFFSNIWSQYLPESISCFGPITCSEEQQRIPFKQ